MALFLFYPRHRRHCRCVYQKGPAMTAPFGRGSETHRQLLGAQTLTEPRPKGAVGYHEKYEKAATDFDAGGRVWIRAEQAGGAGRGFDSAGCALAH
jgi:hypothetical protein